MDVNRRTFLSVVNSSKKTMTKLELLNVFLNDRLTAAAEEIFRAVKETVVEYQSEMLRSKEENERLRRLLDLAVQRLLLQPEPLSIQCQEESQPCQSEWGNAVELLPQVKEEPKLKNIRIDHSHEARDTETENSDHSEPLQRFCSPTAKSVRSRYGRSPTPPPSQEIKEDSHREDSRIHQPASSLLFSPAVHSDFRVAPNASCHNIVRTHKTPKTELQIEGLLHSNGKHSTHALQIKNAKPLKPPVSCSSHPSQSIQRWHSCKECGKGFSFACQLEVHMRWHTKEKPYSCAVCRKSFTTVSMLKRHHRIHTGEKPFRCHVCGKCFNQSAHLNTHFRLHTREKGNWNKVPHTK